MRPHVKAYFLAFGYDESSFIACEICGRPGKEIHHVEPRSKFGSKNHVDMDNPNNLVCLCVKCHADAHGVASRDIKIQLKEIVSKRKYMTKFNPENKAQLTYGETLGPAMEIKDQADADQYKEAMIQFGMSMDPTVTRERAEQVVNQNLGYYAGYYSNDTRARVEKLFKCSHPIFGSVKENGIPTNKEAFECGKQHKTLDEIRK